MTESLHLVAVGASAGGLGAVRDLATGLGAGFPAAVVVVIHTMPSAWSDRAEILAKRVPLPISYANEGDVLAAGRIYLARADHHLIVNGGRLLVRHGPVENNARPAIDPLFRSAAISFGPRAVGVVLSGFNSHDGVSGLLAIKRCGGMTIVQDPDDAEFDGLPGEAIAFGEPDHVAAVADMPALLRRLIGGAKGAAPAVPPDIALEVRIAAQQDTDIAAPDKLGKRSNLTCPECHGSLWEIADGQLVRYRCHVGHAYTGVDLATAQLTEMERALASALRAIEERIILLGRLVHQSRGRQQLHAVRNWETRIEEYRKQAALIRNLLLNRAPDLATEPGSSA